MGQCCDLVLELDIGVAHTHQSDVYTSRYLQAAIGLATSEFEAAHPLVQLLSKSRVEVAFLPKLDSCKTISNPEALS